MAKDGGYNRNNAKGARRAPRHRRSIRWKTAGAENLRAFIDGLTSSGCAVMFGRTSDGGALSLLVLAGSDKYREYIAAEEDIHPIMAELLEDLVGEPAEEEVA